MLADFFQRRKDGTAEVPRARQRTGASTPSQSAVDFEGLGADAPESPKTRAGKAGGPAAAAWVRGARRGVGQQNY